MNPLAFIPKELLLPLIVGLVAGLAGFGLGGKYVYGKWLDERASQAAQAVQIVTRQGQATEKVVTQYRDRVKVREGATVTIEREVERYVEGKPLALACTLDMRWLRLHDAAAAGAVPPPAAGDDAAPGTVTAAAALPTVTANYAACGRTADRLTGLQAWVRGMYETTNGEPLKWPP
jgi:hypothetical protein